MPDRLFGLIGKTLKHSFSKQYFTDKFQKENIKNTRYELFELDSIDEIDNLFHRPGLLGFNVTIPYKLEVIPFLDSLDESAEKVGAVNVVKITSDQTKIGYNSDYYGFKKSLENWTDTKKIKNALILGTGGASKAIIEVLKDIDIKINIVSRSKGKGDLTYENINNDKEFIAENRLIINCTPLGTHPNVDAKPDIQYQWLSKNHYLYDLVYNPEITSFMNEGKKYGAKVKNGLEMLVLQAEKSWEIWNS